MRSSRPTSTDEEIWNISILSSEVRRHSTTAIECSCSSAFHTRSSVNRRPSSHVAQLQQDLSGPCGRASGPCGRASCSRSSCDPCGRSGCVRSSRSTSGGQSDRFLGRFVFFGGLVGAFGPTCGGVCYPGGECSLAGQLQENTSNSNQQIRDHITRAGGQDFAYIQD